MTTHWRVLTPILVAATLLLGASVVAGAGTTPVSVDPGTVSVAPGDTTTVDVVVDNASGGVGAYNLSLSVADPGVARFDGIDITGNPAMQAVNVTDSSATVEVIGVDTTDAGSVTVLSITLIAGEETGSSTSLDLSVAALGDEAGNSYTIGETPGATVSVQEPTTTTTETTSTDGQPGFGLTVTVLALAVTGLLVYRYRN